jgi:hypothetical protein
LCREYFCIDKTEMILLMMNNHHVLTGFAFFHLRMTLHNDLLKA